MRAFFDTSVLVAAFYGDHEHHERSLRLFVQQKPSTGCTAAHCLVEVYSVTTGMPGKARARPDEALLFLQDVRDRLALVTLDEADIVQLLQSAVANRISGGPTYDALIAHCAIKAKAETLYTWNTKHFLRFGERIAALVKEPSS